ncbi:MAG: hypothetical protein KDA77_15360, partial [Planctomycetaceae bacterium]|nr:hypothetical protein [Planctomycetaceae bacterium]
MASRLAVAGENVVPAAIREKKLELHQVTQKLERLSFEQGDALEDRQREIAERMYDDEEPE